MERTRSSPLQQVLDIAENLSLEKQEVLVDILQRRVVDQRRSEMARHATITLQSVREGRAHYGSLDDLKRDLQG